MRLERIKKIVASVTICFLLFSFLIPAKTRAGGAGCCGWEARADLQQVQIGFQAEEWEYKLMTELEATLVSALGEILMKRITNDIVNWIKGDGDPKFITNFREFVFDEIDWVTGDIIDYLGLGWLCESFKPYIRVSLSTIPPAERPSCTVTDIGRNLQSFFDSFTDGGGWTSWIQMAENPQYTAAGAYLLAYNDLALDQYEKEREKTTEAISNTGFEALKDDEGNIVTPGEMIVNMANSALSADMDRKNMEIALYKSKINLNPYLTAIIDALLWRLTQEFFTELGESDLENPDLENPPNVQDEEGDSTLEQQLVSDVSDIDTYLFAALLDYENALRISGEMTPEKQALIDAAQAALYEYEQRLNTYIFDPANSPDADLTDEEAQAAFGAARLAVIEAVMAAVGIEGSASQFDSVIGGGAFQDLSDAILFIIQTEISLPNSTDEEEEGEEGEEEGGGSSVR